MRVRAPGRSPRRGAAGIVVAAALMLAGCAGGGSGNHSASPGPVALAPDLVPLRAGRSKPYRLPATSAAVRARRVVVGLVCRHRPARGYGVHLELYARRLVVPVPAGIGIAPPLQRSGAYVHGGACAYPLRTYEPTGLVLIDHLPGGRLADLFAVWGQPLSGRSLADFHGPVRAYLGGRLWHGRPGQIPLRAHAEIVLEVGAFVAPHPRYMFPPGL